MLTGAHCGENLANIQPAELQIICGEWNWQNEDEPLEAQTRDVQSIKV